MITIDEIADFAIRLNSFLAQANDRVKQLESEVEASKNELSELKNEKQVNISKITELYTTIDLLKNMQIVREPDAEISTGKKGGYKEASVGSINYREKE